MKTPHNTHSVSKNGATVKFKCAAKNEPIHQDIGESLKLTHALPSHAVPHSSVKVGPCGRVERVMGVVYLRGLCCAPMYRLTIAPKLGTRFEWCNHWTRCAGGASTPDLGLVPCAWGMGMTARALVCSQVLSVTANTGLRLCLRGVTQVQNSSWWPQQRPRE